MKKQMLTLIFMIVAAAAIGCKEMQPAHTGCTDSGGTITTGNCCGSTGDFSDTCAVGACGCAPQYSHEVYVCDCGDGRCFDGTACVGAKCDDKTGFFETEGEGSEQENEMPLQEQEPQGYK